MWPFGKNDAKKALALLDAAQSESDDVRYCELVCDAADIAERLDAKLEPSALPIWRRIAVLDPDRARIHELVDCARTKLQAAGVESPPTIVQEYQAYLATLPEDQRILMHVRYLQRVVMSGVHTPAARKAAAEGIALIQECEATKPLSKKQLAMKLAFQDVLKRNA